LKIKELAALIATLDPEMPVGIAYDSFVCCGEIENSEDEGVAIVDMGDGPMLTFCAASCGLGYAASHPTTIHDFKIRRV
jgi:hypothetical protein